MSWRAGSLHYVVFSQPLAGIPDALQPWMHIFGGPPQAFQQLPGSIPGAQASGIVGDYQVVLVAQPGRLELILLPPEQAQSSLGFIADRQAALTALREYARKLGSPQKAVRVALILNAFKPMATAAAAAEDFRRNTRLAHIPAEATDLLLALNVRKTIPGLAISMNRLCKWGTGEQQLIQMQASSGAAPSVTVERFYASTIQLDLNTVPEQAPASAEQADQIFGRFIEEAEKLLSIGYEHLAAQS